MHTPVLLDQVIEAMEIKRDGLYVDATFGEGGYSQAILEKGGKVLAIDLDKDQFSKVLDSRFRGNDIMLVQGNFGEIEKIAKENDFFPVDGVVFDLGLSMRQINQSGRGFSFKKLNEPLDMRMNLETEMTAKYILNHFSESELYEVFAKNSEEINSQKIAREIIIKRQFKKLEIVANLINCIDKAMDGQDNNTYKRIFQALRIQVNDEFENLKNGLTGATKIIKDDGKIAVVTFHSLEDRIVKNFFKDENKKGSIKIITQKPLIPSEEEVKTNPRSRSGKLHIAIT